jgi:diacylglycerol kinase (ATP)
MDHAPDAPLIVVNPRAARLGDAAKRAAIVDAVVHAVRARTGRAPRVESGGLEAAAQALRAAVAARAPLIVAVGGDGTIRQAAEALADGSTTAGTSTTAGGPRTMLAVVPGGTGNVLAGTLGIGGVTPAIEAIRHGEPRTIDLGQATWGSGPTEGRGLFLVACGMGLDARIMAAAEHEWKRRIRFGAYVGAAIKELTRLAAADFRIEADGDVIELRGYLVLVANAGELVPGRLGPRRPIDPTDGRLDLIVLGGRDPLRGIQSAARLLFETGELSGGVIRRPIDAVRITADPVQPIETDGDHHPPGPLEARVLPAALTVLARARRST